LRYRSSHSGEFRSRRESYVLINETNEANEINETNQINEINVINQTNEINETNEIFS